MKARSRKTLGICFWLGCYGLAVAVGVYAEDQIRTPQSRGWQWSADPGRPSR